MNVGNNLTITKTKTNDKTTTTAHFEIFKAECNKWIGIFGLKDWTVNIEHVDLEEDMARFSTGELSDRRVGIGLNTNWQIPVTTYELKKCALHEICHFLLCRIDALAKHRESDDHSITEENHAIVHRLMNAFGEQE